VELCKYIVVLFDDSPTKMVSLYNELNDEDKSILVNCFSDGLISQTINKQKYIENYRISEPLLFAVITAAVLAKNTQKKTDAAAVGLAAAFKNLSSQLPSTLPPDPSDKVERMDTLNFNPGFKNSNEGGKSRRRRHHRRRTIKNRKSRKGRKMRRSYK